MRANIRPCTPEDYPAIIAVQARALCDGAGRPIAPFSVAELLEQDREREASVHFGRWVVERDGQIVGWCEHDQTAYRFHPRKFWLDGYVDPNHQGQGIGSALYDHLMDALRPFAPIAVRNAVREDLTHTVAFLTHRGWEVARKTWVSELDVAAFDPTPYADSAAQVEAVGIAIRTLPELEGDPDRDSKLYELVWEIRQDLPDLDAATKEPFEEWLEQRLHHPDHPPDGHFVAVHEGQYVGYLYHRVDRVEPGVLHIAQLGVARAYRGRHIAVALKLRGNAYARAHGFRVLRTGNDANNQPILRINRRMGFVRQPAYLQLLKTFPSEGGPEEREDRSG